MNCYLTTIIIILASVISAERHRRRHRHAKPGAIVPIPPRWEDKKLLKAIEAKPFNGEVRLECPAIGNPMPHIKWTKDGMVIGRKRFVRTADPNKPYKVSSHKS